MMDREGRKRLSATDILLDLSVLGWEYWIQLILYESSCLSYSVRYFQLYNLKNLCKIASKNMTAFLCPNAGWECGTM